MKRKWGDDISAVTGERVNFHKVYCVCGHSINFLTNNKCICGFCGRVVYASDKAKFKDKLMKEIKRNEQGFFKG